MLQFRQLSLLWKAFSISSSTGRRKIPNRKWRRKSFLPLKVLVESLRENRREKVIRAASSTRDDGELYQSLRWHSEATSNFHMWPWKCNARWLRAAAGRNKGKHSFSRRNWNFKKSRTKEEQLSSRVGLVCASAGVVYLFGIRKRNS